VKTSLLIDLKMLTHVHKVMSLGGVGTFAKEKVFEVKSRSGDFGGVAEVAVLFYTDRMLQSDGLVLTRHVWCVASVSGAKGVGRDCKIVEC
jgi:hypothetical protein